MIPINKKITPEAKRAIHALLKAQGKKAHYSDLRGPTQEEKDKNDMGGKEKVANSLLLEQGYLCAYCMRRIEKVEKIEHWTAQKDLKDKPNETLNYDILLAVCSGETEISGVTIRHCDTKRGELKEEDAVLIIDPTKAQLMQFIKYAKNGQMYFESDSPELNKKVNDDIIRRLALDIDIKKDDYLSEYILRTNRKKAYAAIESLRKSYKARHKNDFAKKLEAYIQKNWIEKNIEGKLSEYCGIVIYFKKDLTRPYY